LRVGDKQFFEKKDALIWYRRAISLSENKIALSFMEALSDSNDPADLEQCVYMMIQPENRNKRIKCAEKLSRYDGKSAKKWLVAAWTLYSQEGNYNKAIEILERLVKIDPSYQNILAETKHAAGNFVESSNLYMIFFKNSNSYERKKEYLLKAILALSSGKLNSKAVTLAKKYEVNYLNDDKMMQKLIKAYLSMGELEAARKLSLKMMKREK
jgi:tetratricopeptide (TPR) repeat protein